MDKGAMRVVFSFEQPGCQIMRNIPYGGSPFLFNRLCALEYNAPPFKLCTFYRILRYY